MKTMLVLLVIAFPCLAGEVATMTGLATYYTVMSCQKEGNSGTKTASGKTYDENAMTCAMRSREWGSMWKVTNADTGKSIIVTLTDFGPGRKPAARGVIIDLTPKAFKELGGGKRGEIKVTVERCAEFAHMICSAHKAWQAPHNPK